MYTRVRTVNSELPDTSSASVGRSSEAVCSKGFLETFRCAKGNKLADGYATKGMQAETAAMPYRIKTVPPYIAGTVAEAEATG